MVISQEFWDPTYACFAIYRLIMDDRVDSRPINSYITNYSYLTQSYSLIFFKYVCQFVFPSLHLTPSLDGQNAAKHSSLFFRVCINLSTYKSLLNSYNFSRIVSKDFVPSVNKNLMTAPCSSKVQSSRGLAILKPNPCRKQS